jgi:hypothetical protein
MPKTCQVSQCRFSTTHTTSAHQCGICGEFGHGQLECFDERLKTELNRYNLDKLPTHLWCNLCPSDSACRKMHSRESHICLNCGERTTNHTTDACIIQDFDVFKQRFAGVPDLEAFETHLFQQYGNNIYTILYAGMGCHLYVRHKDGVTKALFMHQDSWGQYGPTADDTPKMNKFIENCGEVDKLDFQPTLHSLPPSPVEDSLDRVIQCPICRTDNLVTSIKPVYGSEEKCKICFDENVTKFFGECGHLVSCNDCFESL